MNTRLGALRGEYFVWLTITFTRKGIHRSRVPRALQRTLNFFFLSSIHRCTLLPKTMNHTGWVYIMTNKHNTAFYVGMTNNLSTRVWEHRTKRNPKSFTAKYNLDKLVYY